MRDSTLLHTEIDYYPAAQNLVLSALYNNMAMCNMYCMYDCVA